MPLRAGRGILFVAVAAAFVGCSDNSTGPTSPSVPDVSALLSEMSSSTLSGAATIASPMLGAALNSSSPDPSTCQYSSASGFFQCPAVTINGLTFTQSFRLIDDAGNSQSSPNSHTSAFETKTTVDGTVSMTSASGPGGISANSNFTLHGNSDQTLSGIQTGTHTLNGTTVTSMSGSMQLRTGIVLPIDQTVKETTASLVLPKINAGQHWPQSGTITIETMPTTNLSGDTSKTVITFNGTSVVTIATTTLGVTITCHVDLTNPTAGLASCQ